MKIITPYCTSGVNLPYTINIDKPKFKIGIFGDSFAQLAEFESIHTYFNHEASWIYFLANMLKAECSTYGISNASMSDILETVFTCEEKYDFYIVWVTAPLRPSLFSEISYNSKNMIKLKKFLSNKEAVILYWDLAHKIVDLNKPELVCTEYLTNQNFNEINTFEKAPNPLDQTAGYHHMSARGNLLFAIRLCEYIKLSFAYNIKN